MFRFATLRKLFFFFELNRLRRHAWSILKLYGLFSLFHISYKVYRFFALGYRVNKLWEKVPGKEIEFSGSELRKKAENYHDIYHEMASQYPNAPLLKIGFPMPVILCNTPASIQWMLKDEFHNITRGDTEMFVTLLHKFLGKEGIFMLKHGEALNASDHEKWYYQRKVASKIFTKSNFQSLMYDTFTEKSTHFIRRLEQVAERGEKVDLQEMFFSFTMDSIEKFFMGTEVNTIEGGMSEYARAFDAAHTLMMKLLLGTVPFQIVNRFFLPFPFGLPFPGSHDSYSLSSVLLKHCHPLFIQFRREVKALDDHVYWYVKNTRADPRLKDRKDIIANFLNSKLGPSLTDKVLRDIVMNLTIAGRDTTACALSWLFYELTQNLEVQEKLSEEIDRKLKGKAPTLSDLDADNMPYLNGVFYETLRLHPPVPTDQKTVMKDIKYIDGTTIPGGTRIIYSPYALGRNAERFPNPLKFDPERWIPFEQPSLYEFPAFQAGPRFCLGKDMATFEAKLLTSILLQHFSFTLLEGEAEKIKYSMMITISISNHPERKTQHLWCLPKKRMV